LDGADGERRAHGDDFRVDAVFAVKAAFSGRPGIQESQRFGRHGDADFFDATLGAARARRESERQQGCRENFAEDRSNHRVHTLMLCIQPADILQGIAIGE
jgi:hypothetical protein